MFVVCGTYERVFTTNQIGLNECHSKVLLSPTSFVRYVFMSGVLILTPLGSPAMIWPYFVLCLLLHPRVFRPETFFTSITRLFSFSYSYFYYYLLLNILGDGSTPTVNLFILNASFKFKCFCIILDFSVEAEI